MCDHISSSKVRFWGNCHLWQERSHPFPGGDRFKLCFIYLLDF
ncbi:hypothetical protein GXM_07132 [Nostoc sphaeroides CCNUC1]|uniref:Uncharacterized protein n=1 Tax=Nostoc sphaeroides CCNUC1 TaxID=2653204 RepID=A0A5P8WA47_9NOSO|nr:hypothetical protein GXM_07132 [Nostoc sphaeroides CCNUC1]